MKHILSSTIGILVVIILALVFTSFQIVNAGERGIKLTFGVVSEDILGEGLHFKIPFIQKIAKLDVKTKKTEYTSDSASKDLQTVTTTVALNFHPDPTRVNDLYRTIGVYYEERIIEPAIEEAIKAAAAQFTAEELITKRTEVKQKIKESLTEQLHKYFINVEEVSITDFAFSDEFNRAIEQKQTAEQQALKAKWELETVKIQAQQKIEAAKAEAEALRLQKQELTPELVKLRAIEKWNGVLPKVTGGSTPLVSVE